MRGQHLADRGPELVRRHVELDLGHAVRHVLGRVDDLVAQPRRRVAEQLGVERQPDEGSVTPAEPTDARAGARARRPRWRR